jgi:hypothetical protein
MNIDDQEVNNPPYDEFGRLWDKAEKLKILNYKKMTKEELIDAIRRKQK